MAKKQRLLGNDTYFTVYNSDLKLIKDPVKKILFSKIKNWIYRNEDKNSKTHFQKGHWWTFGPYEYWAGILSQHVSEDRIFNIIVNHFGLREDDEKRPRLGHAHERSRRGHFIANGDAGHAEKRLETSRELHPLGPAQRIARQREPGRCLFADVQSDDEQARVPRRERFLPQSQSAQTHHATNRGSDQTDREVYFENSRLAGNAGWKMEDWSLTFQTSISH